MSQEKVDLHKEEKKNIKKTIKKRKYNAALGIIISCAVAAALVVFVSVSAYNKYSEYKDENETSISVDLTPILNFTLDEGTDDSDS